MDDDDKLKDFLVGEVGRDFVSIPFYAWLYICKKTREQIEDNYSHIKLTEMTEADARLWYTRYCFQCDDTYISFLKSVITGYPASDWPSEVKKLRKLRKLEMKILKLKQKSSSKFCPESKRKRVKERRESKNKIKKNRNSEESSSSAHSTESDDEVVRVENAHKESDLDDFVWPKKKLKAVISWDSRHDFLNPQAPDTGNISSAPSNCTTSRIDDAHVDYGVGFTQNTNPEAEPLVESRNLDSRMEDDPEVVVILQISKPASSRLQTSTTKSIKLETITSEEEGNRNDYVECLSEAIQNQNSAEGNKQNMREKKDNARKAIIAANARDLIVENARKINAVTARGIDATTSRKLDSEPARRNASSRKTTKCHAERKRKVRFSFQVADSTENPVLPAPSKKMVNISSPSDEIHNITPPNKILRENSPTNDNDSEEAVSGRNSETLAVQVFPSCYYNLHDEEYEDDEIEEGELLDEMDLRRMKSLVQARQNIADLPNSEMPDSNSTVSVSKNQESAAVIIALNNENQDLTDLEPDQSLNSHNTDKYVDDIEIPSAFEKINAGNIEERSSSTDSRNNDSENGSSSNDPNPRDVIARILGTFINFTSKKVPHPTRLSADAITANQAILNPITNNESKTIETTPQFCSPEDAEKNVQTPVPPTVNISNSLNPVIPTNDLVAEKETPSPEKNCSEVENLRPQINPTSTETTLAVREGQTDPNEEVAVIGNDANRMELGKPDSSTPKDLEVVRSSTRIFDSNNQRNLFLNTNKSSKNSPSLNDFFQEGAPYWNAIVKPFTAESTSLNSFDNNTLMNMKIEHSDSYSDHCNRVQNFVDVEIEDSVEVESSSSGEEFDSKDFAQSFERRKKDFPMQPTTGGTSYDDVIEHAVTNYIDFGSLNSEASSSITATPDGNAGSNSSFGHSSATVADEPPPEIINIVNLECDPSEVEQEPSPEVQAITIVRPPRATGVANPINSIINNYNKVGNARPYWNPLYKSRGGAPRPPDQFMRNPCLAQMRWRHGNVFGPWPRGAPFRPNSQINNPYIYNNFSTVRAGQWFRPRFPNGGKDASGPEIQGPGGSYNSYNSNNNE